MKLAILADIHGNLPALLPVLDHIDRWQPDQVVVNGDIINRAPWSKECLDLILHRQKQAGWQLIRGNHEDYVLSNSDPTLPTSGVEFEIRQSSWWTYHSLNGETESLRQMVEGITLQDENGGEVQIWHATGRGNRDSIMPFMTDEELVVKMRAEMPALFITAHTHRPFLRWVGETLLINVGSVGLPFDGNPRAGYAQLEWRDNQWFVNLMRLPYNRQETERGFIEKGFLEGGGELARLMFREIQIARSLVHSWDMRYRRAVLNGQISLKASVDAMLRET